MKKPIYWLLERAPYSVQAEGLKRAKDKLKYGYFLEQGLGKTGTTFADFLLQLDQDRVDAMIVVAPSYLKSGWEDEARVWGVDVPVITWPDRVPDKLLNKPHALIMNYEATLQGGGRYLEELFLKRRYMLVLDECSAIKNYTGSWAKRMHDLRELATYRRALSGTPMSQSVMDLWPQLRFLGAINGVNPVAFRNRFAVMGGYKGKVVKGVKNEEELHKIIDSVAFRALKEDWWKDMPEKVYQTVEFEMTKRQKEAYESMRHDFYAMVRDEEAVFAEQVITMMLKLQQISRGFIIDEEGNGQILAEPKENPALRTVKKVMENLRGKLIVFAKHKYSVNMLEEMLTEEGYRPAVLRGGMSKQAIAAQKDAFNRTEACRVMVAQDSVGSKGHTLLGDTGDNRCSTTMFYENNYSLETRLQAEDRNHRFGQDKAVVYLDLIGSKMDTKIVAALQRKQDVVDVTINAVRAMPPTS